MSVRWALAAGIALLGVAVATAQRARVDIVQTVGCVEHREGEPDTWWLVRAAPPSVVAGGVFNEKQIEEARGAELADGEIHLVGVADFLDVDALLEWGSRSEFTDREQANATGALAQGRKVLVKGPLIESDGLGRINLMAAVGLEDSCE